MSSFYPFPRLPFELRAHIWALTVEPRIVEVRILPCKSSGAARLVSPTTVPAILQTCREGRSLGLYKQVFSEITSSYVWLNMDIDMVSIGNTPFGVFAPVAASIKRLMFRRQNSDDSFYHFEVKELRNWVNTEEIRVVCEDGMEAWHGASYEHSWPCALENLWFFDAADGRLMRSIEMEQMLDNRLEESNIQNE
ncbi:hypothetical protein GGS20DRAFT_568254 [Poronia punctata]|nr:hypothetical protein GGS20DRAFT_568254 [Poronia punctata]